MSWSLNDFASDFRMLALLALLGRGAGLAITVVTVHVTPPSSSIPSELQNPDFAGLEGHSFSFLALGSLVSVRPLSHPFMETRV